MASIEQPPADVQPGDNGPRSRLCQPANSAAETVRYWPFFQYYADLFKTGLPEVIGPCAASLSSVRRGLHQQIDAMCREAPGRRAGRWIAVIRSPLGVVGEQGQCQ